MADSPRSTRPARLADFLDNRATESPYASYRGLVGQINRDLDGLERGLAAALGQWQTSGSTDPPPLEPIVLYIDDLDRCSPSQVVDVLTAVHLLLAKSLFVVMVAVDPNWLRRSLAVHHGALFALATAPDPAEGTFATATRPTG